MTEKNDLPRPAPRILYLIELFKKERLTEKQHDELDAWVEESDENADVFSDLIEDMDDRLTKYDMPDDLEKIIRTDERKTVLTRVFIGLGIFCLLVTGFMVFDHIYSGNISPAPNTALLQLGNGSIVDLTFSEEGPIATENGTILQKTNGGMLLYADGKSTSAASLYNKLSTWKGSQYTLVLLDGTKVTLSAESSLRYPTRFSGNKRIVELDGEGYFEVAPKMDSSGNQPFIVRLNNGGEIKTLDAHFNARSYSDELHARVTVFQGNAEVGRQNQKLQLHSNQEGVFSDPLTLKNDINVNEVIGWKHGQFVFRDADMETVLREIARWYNVRITVAPDVKAHFTLIAPRNQVLSKLLRQLEETGQVHFKVEGRHVSVLR